MYQSKAIFFLKAQLNLILQVYFACDTLNTELGVELLLKYLSTSTSGLDERMSGGREGSRQLVKPQVGQMQRSPAVTLRKKKKTTLRKTSSRN